MININSTEIFCLIDEENSLCGFLYSIRYKKLNFILYLAVNPKNRAKGYGSQLLRWFLKRHNDEIICLNIDELNKSKIDFENRKKRLDFYLKNGMFLSDIVSKDNHETFHVISNKKNLSLDEYEKLDNYVAEVLNLSKSIVTKINFNEKYGEILSDILK